MADKKSKSKSKSKADQKQKAAEKSVSEEQSVPEEFPAQNEFASSDVFSEDSDLMSDPLVEDLNLDVADLSESEFSFDQPVTAVEPEQGIAEENRYVSEESYQGPSDSMVHEGGFGLDEEVEGSEGSSGSFGGRDIDPREELLEKMKEVQDYVNENKQAVAVGLVVFLVLIYLIFGGSSAKVEDDQVQAEQPAVTIETIAAKETALETELKTFESQFAEFTTGEAEKLSTLAQKISTLYDQARSTKQELIKQGRAIEQLNKSVRSIISERDRVDALGKRKREAVLYTINAIVPGRVWLKSANGHEFTASVGDKLDGYGTISKIEADYGRVVTTTGKVIYIGRDDG